MSALGDALAAQEEGLDPERLSRTYASLFAVLWEAAGMGVHAVELTPATLAPVLQDGEERRRAAVHSNWNAPDHIRATLCLCQVRCNRVPSSAPQVEGSDGPRQTSGDHGSGWPLCSGQGVSGTRDTSCACVGC
jgi:hypothetical protein